MQADKHFDIVVIGAGIAGIATAYYLCVEHNCASVLLVDNRQPMSFTSAQSGDNYRNWWPHPTMVEFTNHSIDLMEVIARKTNNVLNMTRRGYVLATRRNSIDDLITELQEGYGDTRSIRLHDSVSSDSYKVATSADWTTAPDGVDVLSNQTLIRQQFPSFDSSIMHVVHIRRAGDISGQQLGQFMLEHINQAGGKRLTGSVNAIEHDQRFVIDVAGTESSERIRADVVVNAGGPFAGKLSNMMGTELPVTNIFHQKIAFEDSLGAIPRTQPFTIDLDDKHLDWTAEEREWLASEPGLAWLAQRVPGGTHCRPEGGDRGSWVKLGWAYNTHISEPLQDLFNDPHYDPQFPEIVMRGAATLQPSLKPYLQSFPAQWTHYGGYYSMTRENWPLIGPMGPDGAFVAGALSGFGSMAACAAGSLTARHVTGKPLPPFATDLSLSRYTNHSLMDNLSKRRNTGIL